MCGYQPHRCQSFEAGLGVSGPDLWAAAAGGTGTQCPSRGWEQRTRIPLERLGTSCVSHRGWAECRTPYTAEGCGWEVQRERERERTHVKLLVVLMLCSDEENSGDGRGNRLHYGCQTQVHSGSKSEANNWYLVKEIFLHTPKQVLLQPIYLESKA